MKRSLGWVGRMLAVVETVVVVVPGLEGVVACLVGIAVDLGCKVVPVTETGSV